MRSLRVGRFVVGMCALVVSSGAGCSPAEKPPVAQPRSAPVAPRPPIAWTTTLDRDHPLVGRIWSVRTASFVDESVVLAALHGYVLLGEQHDNPDHHALQARMLRAMVDAGRRPVVAFEMFDVDDQAAIDTSRREHPRDAASLSTAVHWEKSGWPSWTNYAPIAQLALDHDLPLVATGLPRSRMLALMKPAEASADGGAPVVFDEGTPLTPEQETSLREELRESHCGHLPEARIGGMIGSSAFATRRWPPRSSPPRTPRTTTTASDRGDRSHAARSRRGPRSSRCAIRSAPSRASRSPRSTRGRRILPRIPRGGTPRRFRSTSCGSRRARRTTTRARGLRTSSITTATSGASRRPRVGPADRGAPSRGRPLVPFGEGQREVAVVVSTERALDGDEAVAEGLASDLGRRGPRDRVARDAVGQRQLAARVAVAREAIAAVASARRARCRSAGR